eukprot:gene22580-29713_t
MASNITPSQLVEFLRGQGIQGIQPEVLARLQQMGQQGMDMRPYLPASTIASLEAQRAISAAAHAPPPQRVVTGMPYIPGHMPGQPGGAPYHPGLPFMGGPAPSRAPAVVSGIPGQPGVAPVAQPGWQNPSQTAPMDDACFLKNYTIQNQGLAKDTAVLNFSKAFVLAASMMNSSTDASGASTDTALRLSGVQSPNLRRDQSHLSPLDAPMGTISIRPHVHPQANSGTAGGLAQPQAHAQTQAQQAQALLEAQARAQAQALFEAQARLQEQARAQFEAYTRACGPQAQAVLEAQARAQAQALFEAQARLQEQARDPSGTGPGPGSGARASTGAVLCPDSCA